MGSSCRRFELGAASRREGNKEGQGRNPADPLRPAYTLSGTLGAHKQQERPEVLDLIYWMLFALQPLSLDELRFATAIRPDLPYRSLRQCQDEGILTDTNEEMERRVKSLSCRFAEIQVQKGTPVVQFIHQSVNDFLLEDGI